MSELYIEGVRHAVLIGLARHRHPKSDSRALAQSEECEQEETARQTPAALIEMGYPFHSGEALCAGVRPGSLALRRVLGEECAGASRRRGQRRPHRPWVSSCDPRPSRHGRPDHPDSNG
jgi:hypothetical protein